MEYPNNPKNGNRVSLLGMGCMRLPVLCGDGGFGSRHSPTHSQGKQRPIPDGGATGSPTCSGGARVISDANPMPRVWR